jgi:L-cystine uptake protein TcyP (sodium:dicarboxylate symporter family)
MRVLKTLVKCIIILVVLFLLSAVESLADWFASNINGEVFIGFLLGVVIAITIASIIKPDKFD